ncbi:GntR family transcriptional regulator [Alteromonas oceanisediminis]|uniref:GntR family transcriptional regulator n=1 Tax=Alteromonas oceanisediminis TaxID=2836180 RepID=UPI001BD914CC|nr:GntR family transcriptional regulator [Alteromonas oceanisediminis]MBT0587659.1 GntR family transcriptional regulator [Alteromonas oceanisediminis]
MFLDDMQIDNSTSSPLYQKIANELRKQILRGQAPIGEAIPSERALREKTGASRVTVRKAIDKLIDEGLLFRKHGSGTFISERIEHKGDDLSGFTDEMNNLGVAPSSIWLVKIHSSATSDEAEVLRLEEGQEVCRLGRVRLSNSTPMGFENAIISAQYLPNLSNIKNSLYHALQINNCAPDHGEQKVTASIATETEAGLLSIREGDPVLRIERRTFLADSTPLEFTRSVYRGDKYVFTSQLQSFGKGW